MGSTELLSILRLGEVNQGLAGFETKALRYCRLIRIKRAEETVHDSHQAI